MATEGSSVMIRVENYDELSNSIGALAAQRVERELVARTSWLCGQGASVSVLGRGEVKVAWDGKSRGRYIQYEREHRRLFAEELHQDLATCARTGRDGHPVAHLSVSWVPSRAENPVDQQARFHVDEALDLDTATIVYRAIAEGCLTLWRQPVCSAHDPSVVLYSECLSRLVAREGGGVLFPSMFIPGLERLGLMRRMDVHVVRTALAELERDASLELGVNVSGQSAVDDVWWGTTLRRLEEMPEVARRLVIEVTETARLPAGGARGFRNRLLRAGCRVAIDDFGAGFGADACRDLPQPDIIKIDASVLRGALSAGSPERLAGMMRIARDQAPVVVVEGVESPEALEMAVRAGAQWVQGFHVKVPQYVEHGNVNS